MLDLFGRGYVIEHCLAEYEQMMDERRYRAYVTDALMLNVENIANQVGGKMMAARWVDGYKPEDKRTAEEIIAEVMEHGGLTFEGGE